MFRILINALRHNLPDIPNQNPLIPSTSRTPPLHAKKTPVHAHRKLRVPSHAPQLTAAPQRQRIAAGLRTRHAHGAPIRPHTARHVVAGGQQHVAEVRAPRELAHRELVAGQHGQRARARRPHVERADEAVNACRRHHPLPVLVPVVRERLGRRRGHRGRETRPRRGRAVNRDLSC